jgi:tetratricopeptide (TPR) repeat protein
LAHQELREARALAESTRSRLQGEVLRTEGGLAAREGKAQESEFFYRQSLAFAEEHHDTYLAATNLSNLGIVALKAGHIDEALARFNAASERARGIRANYILQAALGNAGWAYYDLGDFDRALDNFHQAKAQAHDMNAAASEALWLQSEGLSLYRLGELEQARARYEQAPGSQGHPGPRADLHDRNVTRQTFSPTPPDRRSGIVRSGCSQRSQRDQR